MNLEAYKLEIEKTSRQEVCEKALEKAKGQYGRFDDGVKYIDPRHE